jgi:hypothetical protein
MFYHRHELVDHASQRSRSGIQKAKDGQHKVLTWLLRTGKERFLFLTWHLSYYSEWWSKSSIFSKWGKKGRTDRFRLYKQISTAQTDINCTNKYRLYKQISTVQTYIDCTHRYRLYKQISVICEIDIQLHNSSFYRNFRKLNTGIGFWNRERLFLA